MTEPEISPYAKLLKHATKKHLQSKATRRAAKLSEELTTSTTTSSIPSSLPPADGAQSRVLLATALFAAVAGAYFLWRKWHGDESQDASDYVVKEITLPDNAKPGMTLSITVHGSKAEFKLPQDAKPGMKIRVKVEAKGRAAAAVAAAAAAAAALVPEANGDAAVVAGQVGLWKHL